MGKGGYTIGLYGRYQESLERLRILRENVRDGLVTGGLLGVLFGARSNVLGSAAAWFVCLSLADWILSRHILPLVHGLVVDGYLGQLPHYPSSEAITAVLTVAVGVTGGILAILLAISLLVVELSFSRYTTRVVRFLLNEPYGRRVLGMMIHALLLGLWTLFLCHVLPFRLFLTPVVTLGLCTLSVGSLITYRVRSMVGVLPQDAIEQIRANGVRALERAASRWAGLGRSVDTGLRERLRDNVELLAHFGRVLVTSDREEPERNAAVMALGVILMEYILVRRRFHHARSWFPLRQVRVPTDNLAGQEFARPYRTYALGPAVKEEPDTEWLENLILARTRVLATEDTESHPGQPDCARAAGFVLPQLLQDAWEGQEETVFYSICDALERLLRHSSFHEAAGWLAVQELYKVAYVIVDDHRKRTAVRAQDVPWASEEAIVRLGHPAIIQDVLLTVAEQVRIERDAYARVVTPPAVLTDLVNTDVNSRLDAFQDKAFARVWDIVAEFALEAAASCDKDIAPSLARMLLLLYRRPIVRGRPALAAERLTPTVTLVAWLTEGMEVPTEAMEELSEETNEAVFGAIDVADTDALRTLLPLSLRFVSRRYPTVNVDSLDCVMSFVAAVGGYALGVSELRQMPGIHDLVKTMLASASLTVCALVARGTPRSIRAFCPVKPDFGEKCSVKNYLDSY